MKFTVKRKHNPKPSVDPTDFDLAKQFSKAMQEELDDFLKAVILYGSVARGNTDYYGKDIDVMIIIDDLTRVLSKEVIQTYRVITENVAARISRRLHINTMKLSNFWDYVRNADPVVINMLRDGYALHDTGFFEPAQQLLRDGRMAPTRESVFAYYARAPMALSNSTWNLLQATTDLYWAVMDSAHAAIMKAGHIAESPKHVGQKLQELYVKEGLLGRKYPKIMNQFYDLNKGIAHRTIRQVSGKQYDEYRKQADDFVKAMEKLLI